MTVADQPLTIGIEEEYMLVDPETRDLVSDPPAELLAECGQLIDAKIGGVTSEFLRVQIEVDTTVCSSLAECRTKIAALRGCIAQAAAGRR